MVLKQYTFQNQRTVAFHLFGSEFVYNGGGGDIDLSTTQQGPQEKTVLHRIATLGQTPDALTKSLKFCIHGPRTEQDSVFDFEPANQLALSDQVASAIISVCRNYSEKDAKWSCLQIAKCQVNSSLIQLLEAVKELGLFETIEFQFMHSLEWVLVTTFKDQTYSWQRFHCLNSHIDQDAMVAIRDTLQASQPNGSNLRNLLFQNVTYDNETTTTLSQGLAANHSLASISFESKNGSQVTSLLSAVRNHKALQSLLLPSCHISDEGLQHLGSALSHPTSLLATLVLDRCKRDAQESISTTLLSTALRGARSLKTLSLRHLGLNGTLLPKLLPALQTCPCLTTLDMTGNQLNLSANDDPLAKGITGHPSLQRLILRGTAIGVSNVKNLASIVHTCPHLREVDVSDNEYRGIDFSGLSVPPSPQLYKFNLGEFVEDNSHQRNVLLASLHELLKVLPAVSLISDDPFFEEEISADILHVLAFHHAGRGQLGRGRAIPPSLWPKVLKRTEAATSKMDRGYVGRPKGGSFHDCCLASILFALFANNPTVILSSALWQYPE